jgi:NhaA family Na+:H+ antiporter
MPIFALANSGVRLDLASIGETLSHTLFQGISLGLFIGKPVGIMATCLLAVSLGWAQKPKSLNWSHLLGASCLAGIGFTMSIFISSLALPEEFSNLSKTGIIMGSLASGLVGATLLWLFLSRDPQRQTGEAE